MPYRRILYIIFVSLTIILFGTLTDDLIAQYNNQKKTKGALSEIVTEAFAFKSDSDNRGRLDIYVQIPYSEINFIKEGNQYISHTELSVSARTKEKQTLWQTSQTIELQLKDFSQTISHRLSTLKRISTDLTPGNYEILLQVIDSESKKMDNFYHSAIVKDFGTDSLALSDLMLVYRMNVSGTRKNIVPNLTGILTKESNEFFLFFEIYNRIQLDSVQLLCKFINRKKEVVAQRVKNQILSGNLTQITWQIDTPSLAVDQYIFSIEATGYSKINPAIMVKASSSRTCSVHIKDLPFTITDIDKATDQLQYIAVDDEITYIEKAATPDEKQKRFFEFWAKRDPDPGTSQNELMEEYYARVAYANKKFTQLTEGWRTDRGMVFIRFGLPQDIDSHPFDAESKPYEIWYYYNHNREFIFVDETGFGDYRLRYPESDYWRRVR